jgi:two-component system osmolarity sensor histidine kinase EnvZ
MIVTAAREIFERIARFADRHSPQTLFARALIIIVVPMLLLQALSAWWFYSQRGDNVTNRLAILLVRDLRMLIALRTEFPDDAHRAWSISTLPPARSRARSRPTSSATTTSTTISAAARC